MDSHSMDTHGNHVGWNITESHHYSCRPIHKQRASISHLKLIRASHMQGGNWRREVNDFHRTHCTTPHTSASFSPHRLLFGCDPKTKLPEHQTASNVRDDDIVRKQDVHAKSMMKYQAFSKRNSCNSCMNVGGIVLVRQPQFDKLSTPFNPRPLTITNRQTVMVTVSRPDGSTMSMFHQWQPLTSPCTLR